jgi:hypothetical protein
MQPRRIRDIGYTIDELNETEQDLIRGLEELGGDKDVTIRIARIIANKFNFARNIVRGQQWLERNGHIIVER